MEDPFQRAWLLYNQNRPDLAEREVRERIGEHPGAAEGFMLLARCLDAQKKPKEAEEAARRALELDPDDPICHFVLADTIYTAGKLDEAERAIDTALESGWPNPGCHAVKSNILALRHKWQESLEAADRGLELDPEHVGCINARAYALTKLGRHEESAATIGDTLARDPEDPYTHANQGWMLLHTGDAKQAKVHFQEALRLNPTITYARDGLLEALRAENRIYRQTLRFMLWLTKFKMWMIYAGLIAFVLVWQFGKVLLEDWTKARWPALVLSMVVMTPFLIIQFGKHFLNALLTFHPVGRLALPASERALSALVSLLALGAFAAACVFIFQTHLVWLFTAATLFLLSCLAGMDYPPQDRRSGLIRLAVFATAAAVGGFFVREAYQLREAQFAAMWEALERNVVEPTPEEKERVAKLPQEERQKVVAARLKAVLEVPLAIEKEYGPKRQELSNRFRWFVIACFVIWFFGNPLETKKADD